MKTCYIVGAGEVTELSFDPEEEDLVIACDGGYEYCKKWNKKVNLVIGDFDSLGYVPEHPNVIRLKPEKDDTDTACAIRAGLEQGFQRFIVYGGTGGRISHTIANINKTCAKDTIFFYHSQYSIALQPREERLLRHPDWERRMVSGDLQ